MPVKGDRLQIGCVRAASIQHTGFNTGDIITVELARDVPRDELNADYGGGPWGGNGMSARDIKAIARSIRDDQTDRIIWRR